MKLKSQNSRMLDYVPDIKDDIYNMEEVNIPVEKCINFGKSFEINGI